MKRLILIFLAMTAIGSYSFPQTTANAKDVSSIDAIIGALYDVISGPVGEKRDWGRMRSLFVPEARLIPTGRNPHGETFYRMMSVDDYVNTSGKWLEGNGFFEKEIHRRVHQYGTMAQVFSTYAARKSEKDEKPFMRGINSIQLMNDGERWWILNVYWLGETNDNLLPKEYLPEE